MNVFYSHGKQVGPMTNIILITFYVDGRVLHFRRHAVMATLFLVIYYVPHTLDISVSCDCW